MVTTYRFVQGVKRKACANFLDSIWGTIGFFEKIRMKFAIWGQRKTKNKLIKSFLPRALLFLLNQTLEPFRFNKRRLNMLSFTFSPFLRFENGPHFIGTILIKTSPFWDRVICTIGVGVIWCLYISQGGLQFFVCLFWQILLSDEQTNG